eukprot:6201527-Pleurochrysis_carterae.AAC.1
MAEKSVQSEACLANRYTEARCSKVRRDSPGGRARLMIAKARWKAISSVKKGAVPALGSREGAEGSSACGCREACALRVLGRLRSAWGARLREPQAFDRCTAFTRVVRRAMEGCWACGA